MYNYDWDELTGGYILNTKTTGVIKEVRPAFYEELDLLGFKEKGWKYPNSEEPLLWAEARRYFYKGRLVAEANGGGLYTKPTLKIYEENLELEPVNIDEMILKNKGIMNGLVQKTLADIYNTYKRFSNKNIDIFYVAFSGGKDSIVMLDLVQRALPHDAFYVVFSDTKMEVSDTYKAIEIAQQRWSDLKWRVAKSHFSAKESWSKFGPPARTIRWCCSVHKTAPSLLELKRILVEELHVNKVNFKAFVFDGIRAEESDARATYSMVSEGNKHAIQTNCSPILEWNTSELFLYLFENRLMINEMYRKGSSRVGCRLCPMASNWYEYILNSNYSEEINELSCILDNLIKKDFISENDKQKYYENGGWKSRVGGRELDIGENKLTEIITEKETILVLKNMNYNWKTWLKALGDLIPIDDTNYIIEYKDLTVPFKVEGDNICLTITYETLKKSKLSIRFQYLFKNALSKAAYCNNCQVCMVECPHGALHITKEDIIIKDCRHCENCLDSPKGCLAAKSLSITGGGNNVSAKNISRYQNFGFRKEWLELFFEMENEFWSNERMGKYMFVGFKVWLKEAGLTISNAFSPLATLLKTCGADDKKVWGVIATNLAYESSIFNWYVKNLSFNTTYQSNDIDILLGDDYSQTTKKNALSSLKETLRYSPIGEELGLGNCELKGKTVISITKAGWKNPDPLVVLYTLYKFAEMSDKLYSFTLSDLVSDSPERTGISPAMLFGIDRDTLKQTIQGLAIDYPEYVQVAFNKDLENINLNSNNSALDIVNLF